MVSFYIDFFTDIGNVRECNEDNYIIKTGNISGKNAGVFCVADGMGGLSYGDIASSIATEYVASWWDNKIKLLSQNSLKLDEEFWEYELRNIFRSINSKILSISKGRNIKKSGSTFSLLLIYDNKYFIIHAGDSRIYIKNKKYFKKLTEDQTLTNMLIKKGAITEEEGKKHNKKHVLYNCLGVFENPEEYFYKDLLKNRDTFLLCSDGLYNMICDEDIKNIMGPFKDIAKMLVTMAKEQGGKDNITAIYVCAKKFIF